MDLLERCVKRKLLLYLYHYSVFFRSSLLFQNETKLCVLQLLSVMCFLSLLPYRARRNRINN